MSRKAWTEVDVQQLRDLWPYHSAEYVAEVMGRPRTALYVKASELGLRKEATTKLAIRSAAQKKAVRTRQTADLNFSVVIRRQAAFEQAVICQKKLRSDAVKHLVEHGVDPLSADLAMFLISKGLIPAVRIDA